MSADANSGLASVVMWSVPSMILSSPRPAAANALTSL